MTVGKTDLVSKTYSMLGRAYLGYRSELKSESYIRRLLKNLPNDSQVLDVGCGMGVPVDDIIVKCGHAVTGIDLSSEMISEAKRRVKGASYYVRDMTTLREGEYLVDVVVCLYAIFHIPRTEHERIIRLFASFLPKGGLLLISMGNTPFDGEHVMYGVKSYASQWGVDKNIEIIQRCNFEITWSELKTSGGENHLVVIAKKK